MSLPVFSLGVDYERCQLQVLGQQSQNDKGCGMMMRDEGLSTWMTGLLMSLPVFSHGVDYDRCQLQVLG